MRGILGVGAVLWGLCAVGCGDSGDTPDDGGRDDVEGGACTDGEGRCVGPVGERCEGGRWVAQGDCAGRGQVCAEGLGCVDCQPGLTFCDGNDVRSCNDDGMSSTLERTCDPAEGESCDVVSGTCISPCRTAATNRSNIGCEYWAVDLDNAENAVDTAAAEQFAVVVANLNDTYVAEVNVERDVNAPGQDQALEYVDYAAVNPGDVHTFYLPRWDVDGDNAPGVDDDPQTTLSRRVYRLRSSIPVVAYQFNPIVQAFSNSASVLLPTTGLDLDYSVVVWSPANPMPLPGMSHPNRTYVTIVGTQNGTSVWVRPTYDIFEGVGDPYIGAIPAGEEVEFYLDQFDVLNLETSAMRRLTDPLPDLTGTTVRASAPVAVFTGVDLASVGGRTLPDGSTDSCCAEHMEAQVVPTSALGARFVISRSPPRSDGSGGWLEYDYYRVLAVADGTQVRVSDPEVGEFELGAGEWREFSLDNGFVLETNGAEHPVHLVQYLTSRDQCYSWRPGSGGDPDMTYMPPVEQRRTNYIFATGEGFTENWAVISMPEGASATLDGADVVATCRSPRTDGDLDGVTWRAYYCPIADGRHEVVADDERVGVIVYGYYNAGSYVYPAGAELRRIFFG